MRWITLPLLFVAACGTARDYRMDKVSDTMALLRIVRIQATPQSTVVTMRYQTGEEMRRIGVHPPGHSGAFTITDANDDTDTYKLTRIEGVGTLPERTNLTPGTMLEFKLAFEPIPASLKSVHITEGEYDPEEGEKSWEFLDVELH